MESVGTALSLYQFGIETLGRIQLARDFQDDFDSCQLKLDIIQLRLSRWGEIANITTIDSILKNGSGTPQVAYDVASMLEILEGISDRLVKTERQASAVRKKIDAAGAQALDPESCLPMNLKKVRTRFTQFLRKRKAQTTKVIECLKWVFYKKEHFDKFIADMSELVDGLERLMPEDDREKLAELSEEECGGISKANLEDLKEVIGGCDPWLETSVDKKLNASQAGTVINQSYNTGSTVGIHKGHNKGISYGANSSQTNTFN